jgi:ParB-like chromosome segregation protein Spo0J
MSEMKIGFEMRKVRLPLSMILPVRQIKNPEAHIVRFEAIRKSVKEIGLIEPLVVHPQNGDAGHYLLVDGHLRLLVLKELGETEADCIIACDDESYTYNARINRVPPIQEHKMIVKAVQSGVKPERIAAVLHKTVSEIQATITLLDGINKEAVELLKTKAMSPQAIRLLKKVTGVRQIEIVELMISSNNFTLPYVEALILGTPKNMLVSPDEPKEKAGLTAEQIGRMEEELEGLESDFKVAEESYGDNMLNLTLARGYIKRLVENEAVTRLLKGKHPEILAEFQAIAAAESV